MSVGWQTDEYPIACVNAVIRAGLRNLTRSWVARTNPEKSAGSEAVILGHYEPAKRQGS